MKKFLFLMLIPTMVAAQQTINGLNIKGKLDVISTTKSSNPCPSMTEAQRDSISAPSIGSCVYNTSDLSLNVYDGAEWKSAGGGGISLWLTLTNYKTDDVVIDSNKIYKSLSDHTSGVFATDLANGDWVEVSASEIVDLTTDVTGILPIANGGTGASAKNFVDLTTNQSVAGNKTLTGETTFNNRVTMTGIVNIDRPEGIVKTDNAGNIEVGKIDLTDEVVGSLPQNNGGNGNLIPTNASFELSPVNTDWTCSAIVPSASGTASVDGAQGITFTASSANQGCTRYVSMPEGNVGKLLEYSMYVKSTGGDVEVCSINDSIVSNCKTYTIGQSNDVTKIIITDRPKNTNSNANGILFRTKTATSTTFLGDLAYVGLPKSDEAIVAKFDNTTGWVDSGYIASDFTSFGTVTDIKLKSKREKDKLRIVGSFLAGTGTGTLATFKIKFNGVYLSTPSLFDTSSAPILAGDYFRIVTADNDPNKGGKLLINSGSSTVNFSRPILYGAGAGMPNVLETGSNISPASRVVFIDATIPIAEWSSQTNAAIVACKEGPLKCTNTVVFKRFSPDLFALDQFGNSYPVTKGANTGYSILNLSSLSLANPMICTATLSGGSGFFGWTTILNPTTNTAATVYTVNGSGTAAVDAGFNITCTKTGSDYNEAYDRIVIQKDDADIRSTEWLTGGFDYIDNKPIYKRCHKVVSDITTTGNIATWPTNLSPIEAYIGQSDRWFIETAINGSNYVYLSYIPVTGVLYADITGTYRIKANTKICMKYTK